MVNLLFAGALGGLVRGMVGFLKYQFTYKNVPFKPAYIGTIMVLSAFVGAITTWAIAASDIKFLQIEQINPAVALIFGYAGGDLIENIYKIILGKSTIYPTTKK
jgi:hypothetical protein